MICTSIQNLALEHYRYHVIEQWPDGPRKTAGLAAAQSTLESLRRIISGETLFVCTACARELLQDRA